MWNHIISEFSRSPRDVSTSPICNRTPHWFFTCSDGKHLYVESGKNHKHCSKIQNKRELKQKECDKLFELYLRRKNGEAVSAEATIKSVNQVYWYGIFSEMGY